MTKLSLINFSLLLFDYLDSDDIPFTFCMKYDEIRSQPYSGEYDWLGPDFTPNTQRRYILILLAVLVTPVTIRSQPYSGEYGSERLFHLSYIR